MAADLRTAEKLVRWYNEMACGCPLLTRITRVLGSLGGGVDAVAVRSRPNLDSDGVKEIPERISNLIEAVLLERALTKPDLAASAFDMADKLLYCTCNNVRGNFNVCNMTAWENTSPNVPAAAVKVTCPVCTVEYGGEKPAGVKPVPLMTLFRRKAELETFPERAETKRLHAALLVSSSGGCGIYNNSSQQTSFNGSWTCLLLKGGESTKIEAEVLISNKISHSVRLQPVCVCPDLLYAICSTAGGSEFAYRARNLSVVEGGEFLYFRYTLFEEGGPFDSKIDLKNLINTEPTSETDCLMAAAALANNGPVSDDTPRPPPPPSSSKKRKLTEGTVYRMNTTNEVDVQSLLMTILSGRGGGGNNNDGKRHTPNKKKKLNNLASVTSSDEQFPAPPMDKCKTEYILPCPQIEEQTIRDYQRQNHLSYNKVIKHNVDVSGVTFAIRARSFRNKYILPPSNTLFSPPLIVRTNFNRYKLVSGAPAFFDRVEIEDACGSVVLGNNAAHSAILRLLLYIRENSLKRSVEAASIEGLNVIIKTPATNIGVPVSSKEIKERRLCTATILGMLAGLGK